MLKSLLVKGFKGHEDPAKKSWHEGWLVGRSKIDFMNRPITKNEFRQKVLNAGNLSIVQFKIEWSGACQIISPIYEELAAFYKEQANFFTVDVESEKGLDLEYGVMELPTILFFWKGQVIDHVKGLASRNAIVTKLENALTESN